MFATGLLLLGYCLIVLFGSVGFSSDRKPAVRPEHSPKRNDSEGITPAPGGLGRLEIPRVGVSVMVVEVVESGDLKRAAG